MYLLDTHALLWALYEPKKLPTQTAKTIVDSDTVFASIASLWEIAIKQGIGKLEIDCPISTIVSLCEQKDIGILRIKIEHLELLKMLPQIHRDPFDRLLIAQAQTENLTLITKDEQIAKYDINTLW